MRLANILLIGAGATGVYLLMRGQSMPAATPPTAEETTSGEYFNLDFLGIDFWNDPKESDREPLTTENAFDDGNWITDTYEDVGDWLSGTWDNIWN